MVVIKYKEAENSEPDEMSGGEGGRGVLHSSPFLVCSSYIDDSLYEPSISAPANDMMHAHSFANYKSTLVHSIFRAALHSRHHRGLADDTPLPVAYMRAPLPGRTPITQEN